MFSPEFLEFKDKYNKKYNSEKEEYNSFSNFNNNLDLIRTKNLKLKSYKLGINQFSDKTMEFLNRRILSSHLNESSPLSFGDYSINNNKQYHGSFQNIHKNNDKNIDWTKNGYVSRVKDQGACGSCWAFSTTGALESMIHINNNKHIELSEQELISCSIKNLGCNGGWMHKAFDYVLEKKGLYSNKDYPYNLNNVNNCNNENLENIRITESGNFHYIILPSNSISHMKQAIFINPICAAVDADFDFIYYKEGIFDKSITHNPTINHAILITALDQEKNIWKLKNSWGSYWGENGYMDISIKDGSGVAGLNTYCIIPIYSDQR